MLVEILPQVAREVAAPIAAITELTIVSADGAGALPKQVVENVTQTLAMLKTSTGLDLAGVIQRAVEGKALATTETPAASTTHKPAGAQGS